MTFHENRLPADDSHDISCLICYFWKSDKIWKCRLLQIIDGALWVNCLYWPVLTSLQPVLLNKWTHTSLIISTSCDFFVSIKADTNSFLSFTAISRRVNSSSTETANPCPSIVLLQAYLQNSKTPSWCHLQSCLSLLSASSSVSNENYDLTLYLSRHIWFPTMWHFDMCRLKPACAASF